jgi:hypothetical protein
MKVQAPWLHGAPKNLDLLDEVYIFVSGLRR